MPIKRRTFIMRRKYVERRTKKTIGGMQYFKQRGQGKNGKNYR